MTMGEWPSPVGRGHELPGWLFIGWCYLSSALLIVMSVYLVVNEPLTIRIWMGVLAAVAVSALHWRLGGKVRRFSPFGWYGAMLELAGATAAKVGLFGIGGLLMCVIEVLWMRYFWNRRARFGVHLGG
jgi:hypothetical protein